MLFRSFYGDASAWTGGLVHQGGGGYIRMTPAVANNRNITVYQGSNIVISAMGDEWAGAGILIVAESHTMVALRLPSRRVPH